MLADSFGVAPSTMETYHALTLMHPRPGDVRVEDMIDLYGEPKPVGADRSETIIGRDKVRECIATAPPPHLTPQGRMGDGTPRGARTG